MTDIMPCQICMSNDEHCVAYINTDWAEPVILCECCSMRGPVNYNGNAINLMFEDEDDEDLGDWEVEEMRDELLIKLWNEMQTLIARGLILNDSKPMESKRL